MPHQLFWLKANLSSGKIFISHKCRQDKITHSEFESVNYNSPSIAR